MGLRQIAVVSFIPAVPRLANIFYRQWGSSEKKQMFSRILASNSFPTFVIIRYR